MKELKPCPCCHSPAYEFMDGSYWLYIGCTKCGIRTHQHAEGSRDQIHHYAVWNNRRNKK